MNEKIEKLRKLAREVMVLSRNTLLVNLRFLDLALSRLQLFETESTTIMTDGEHVLYNPMHVLTTYKAAKETPVRDYLHLLMHCVFRHMFVDPSLEHIYWDLACDIAVENVISELGIKAVSTPREQEQTNYLLTIKKELKLVTAEKLYAYLKSKYPKPDGLSRLINAFRIDDHQIWYMSDGQKAAAFGMPSAGGNSNSSGDGEGDGDGEGESNTSEDNQGSSSRNSQEGSSDDVNGSSFSRMDVINDWADIAQRMQLELETFAKNHGQNAGSMTQNLKAVNREKYDYTQFLKKFAVMGEAMRINDDEFDYIFYTYGLKLYDKMPLIEPLEYKEIKAIKEFVIAIDTSGSTSGELVQKFVQKTYNILCSTESFFSKINLHIIQCDAKVQEDVKITCKEEFDEYLKKMTIRGLGGTDFRPVFEYVEKLQRNKEFANLKGLIYFTDGYGDFPAKKPDYNTAFVYLDDEYNNPKVPSWAIKLVLQKDEI